MLLRRLARPLLASAFVVDGVDTLMHPEPRAKAATTLVERGERRLPPQLASKLPSDPGTVVRVNAAAQVSAGVLLALGRMPRLSAVVLACTVVPATVTEQDFWNENDPDRRGAKRAAFLKDMGLLGGLMIAAADTEGKPSLGWRGRRAARRAAAALPFTTSADPLRDRLQHQATRGRHLAESLAEAAQTHGTELAEAARTRGAELTDTALQRGSEAADVAKHRSAELAKVARHRGTDWAEVAKHRGGDWADVARHRGADWADVAKHRGADWADVAKHRGADVAKHRGVDWADVARHRGADWADVAKHRGADWADVAKARGADWAEVAKQRGSEIAEVAKQRGAELAETARERGPELAETAQQQGKRAARQARRKASELAELTRTRSIGTH
ncbi:DoxX family protein [Nocardia terpenica]|uniref:DoxX family membrane protein n=1 Tax=Nocardia terpenica TaxID=455432 RepID=A0A6G9Z2I2_9NOCA|nr:DoxX family protein [Nocardia terpenica]QIS19664.1 DoxX family membrane protein [Nocardia terpenica]